MYRRLLVTGLTVLVALGLGSVAAQSDDLRPLQDRLERLERDINLLQRQVYRGGGAPAAAGAPVGGAAIDVEVRLGRLEEQMRGLTGQIEDTSYKIQQLSQRLDRLQTDIDFRLGQLEHPGSAPAPAAAPGAPPQRRGAPSTAAAAPAPPPAPATADLGGSSSGPIRLRPPGAGSAADPSQPPPPGGVLGTVVVPADEGGGQVALLPPQPAAGTPLDQYNAAFALLRQARYDEAEQALRAFIQRNPKDALAGNAQYWLGETFYARKDYPSAASAFAEGYEKYPHSPKAPDDLLKLGMSLAVLGQRDNACRAFQRLDRDFPQVQAEIRDRANAEKKRLGCAA
jgi:tol-pal system protein YbgF